MLERGRSLTGPETAHLQKRRDFLAARNGARAHCTFFVLQLHRRHANITGRDASLSGQSPLRIGFTVTRKIGNAVTRNRVRRRLRAAVALATIPPQAAGHDAVIIAKPAALNAPFPDLVAALDHAFTKAVQPDRKAARNAKPPLPLQNRPKRGKPASSKTDTKPDMELSKVARGVPTQ